MSLGKRINYLRLQENISQEVLANEVGVSRQTISKWETYQSIPEVDKVQILAEYFGVSLDYLLYGKNEEHEKYQELALRQQNSKINRFK